MAPNTTTSSDRSPLTFQADDGGMLDFGQRLIAEAGRALDLSGSDVARLTEPERLVEVWAGSERAGLTPRRPASAVDASEEGAQSCRIEASGQVALGVVAEIECRAEEVVGPHHEMG